MKRLFLMLIVGATFASCEKGGTDYSYLQGKMLYIQGLEMSQQTNEGRRYARRPGGEYTLAEIMRDNTLTMHVKHDYDERFGYMDFHDDCFRDTINNRLIMEVCNILGVVQDGEFDHLNRSYIDSPELVFTVGWVTADMIDSRIDTVGYIPQSVVRRTRELCDSLWELQQLDKIVEAFNDNMVFYHCTAAEYKQIVANGGN